MLKQPRNWKILAVLKPNVWFMLGWWVKVDITNDLNQSILYIWEAPKSVVIPKWQLHQDKDINILNDLTCRWVKSLSMIPSFTLFAVERHPKLYLPPKFHNWYCTTANCVPTVLSLLRRCHTFFMRAMMPGHLATYQNEDDETWTTPLG